MADEISEATGVQATLIKGTNGIFDVTVNGKTIFSKYKVGRFPSHGEILAALEASVG